MSITNMPQQQGLAAYVAVTAAYWAFMLTDGALRMLVLLHFHLLGFSPLQLAYLFLLYEFMGVVTNLAAGWLAARFGLAATLYAGLSFQVVALAFLYAMPGDIEMIWAVVYVMLVQGLSGIAKDLAKMSSKSAVKLLAPDRPGSLFRWVAMLTGSKNAVKGLGFFIGAALLALIGFDGAVLSMGLVLFAILLAVSAFMPSGLPSGKKEAKFKDVFSKDRRVNILSLARMFLFGARDVWFVVGIPIFFYGALSDGSPEANKQAFFIIGMFMAAWIIGYGVIQALAPKFFKNRAHDEKAITGLASSLLLGVVLIPLALGGLLWVMGADVGHVVVAVVALSLLGYGAVFALNSSVHSYLILAFTSGERVTMDVGFYYMSNAAGRFLGTLLSGVSYSLAGVAGCLIVSGLMALASFICVRRLKQV